MACRTCLPFSSKVISRNPNFARWYATEQPIAPPPQTTTCDEAGRGRSPSVRQRTDCLKLCHLRLGPNKPDRTNALIIVNWDPPPTWGNPGATRGFRYHFFSKVPWLKSNSPPQGLNYIWLRGVHSCENCACAWAVT